MHCHVSFISVSKSEVSLSRRAGEYGDTFRDTVGTEGGATVLGKWGVGEVPCGSEVH